MPPALASLPEEEFKALIAEGKTINVGRINERLVRSRIDATDLAALGIEARRDRNATHIRASDCKQLCVALADHYQQLAQASDSGADSPGPATA